MTAVVNHRVQIDEKRHTVSDPVITGRQLLDEAGKRPVDEHLIFQLLKNGQLEEIGLDETVDLRKSGIEKFITWRSDRAFYFVIDGRRLPWGAPLITGRKLKELAGVDINTFDIWLDVRGGSDRKIANAEQVDLQQPGVERFFTGKPQTREG